MNLMLHGIGGEKEVPLIVSDSLASDPNKRFDIVMTNPPFGKKSSTTIVGEDGKASKEKETYETGRFFHDLQQTAQFRSACQIHIGHKRAGRHRGAGQCPFRRRRR